MKAAKSKKRIVLIVLCCVLVLLIGGWWFLSVSIYNDNFNRRFESYEPYRHGDIILDKQYGEAGISDGDGQKRGAS